jgi:phosphoglycerate dehydrogenase-like enzyme
MSQNLLSVVVAIDFSDEIIEQLQAVSPRLRVERHFPEVEAEVWQRADILYTYGVMPEPGQAPKLKWVQLNSAGVDHVVNTPLVQSGDVMVTSASGIHAVPMTEYAIGMMIAWAYQFPLMFKHQQQRHWDTRSQKVFAPQHLRGKTLGIVGYGSIGRELARAAHALGMNILVIKNDVMHPAEQHRYNEPGTGDPEAEIPDRIYPPEAIRSMASECDILVMLAPLTDRTEGMLDAGVFKAMRDKAVFMNMARGRVVNEADLIEALEKGEIAGAVLDVFETEPLPSDSPLWAMDNVIISPHVAGNSSQYHARAAALFAENLQRYLERQPLLNRYKPDRGY